MKKIIRHDFFTGGALHLRMGGAKVQHITGGPEVFPSPMHEERHERAERLRLALEQLEMADRVALKLVDATEWMKPDEIDWLARRLGRSANDVQRALLEANDTYALTRIFDPGDDDPNDPQARGSVKFFVSGP